MYEFLKNRSALYIEDEKDVSNNISKLLSKFFDKFYTTYDGIEALEVFYNHHIDVMLVDIELPKMSGIEFIREVRKNDQNVKIIIISAYTKTDYLLESVELGLSKYIVKPLTSSKIHTILETINSYYTENIDNSIDVCNMHIDKSKYRIIHNNQEFNLSKKELLFLKQLIKFDIVSYEALYTLWYNDIPSDTAVRSFIKYFRQKLPNGVLKNKSGVGYYLECKNENKE